MQVLMPVAQAGFDPTEAGIPFVQLRDAGHQVVVATPTGAMAEADPRMLTGQGLALLAPVLCADARGRAAYAQLAADDAFRAPRSYASLDASEFDALLLPGGHAKPMRTYLESPMLHRLTRDFFAADKPVGAICHGVVVAARAKRADGRSVLHGHKTTSPPRRKSFWPGSSPDFGSATTTGPIPRPSKTKCARRWPCPATTWRDPWPCHGIRRPPWSAASWCETAATYRRAGPAMRTASRRPSWSCCVEHA